MSATVPCECYGGWCFEGQCTQGKDNSWDNEWFVPHPGQRLDIEDFVKLRDGHGFNRDTEPKFSAGLSICAIEQRSATQTPIAVFRSVVAVGDTVIWTQYRGRGYDFFGRGLLVGDIPPHAPPEEILPALDVDTERCYHRYSWLPRPYWTFFVLSPRDDIYGRPVLRRPLRLLMRTTPAKFDFSAAPIHKDGRTNATLNAERVYEMRCAYHSGGWTKKKLARFYGVSLSTIHHVLTGYTWSEIPGPLIPSRDNPSGAARLSSDKATRRG